MTPVMVGRLRLVIGLLQGGALFWLYRTIAPHEWPSTDGPLFGSLAMIGIIVPLLFIINLGAMRLRNLILWMFAAGVIIAVLVVYDFYRRNGMENRWLWMFNAHEVAPSFSLVLFTGVGFFIAQSLISAGDAEHKFIASFPRYFDVAWKLAVQAVITLGFIGLLWMALLTGTMLFELIGIHFVRDLMEHTWFSIPVTTLAIACSIHITDVRANLVRGIRTLKLTLLSSLLPLMVLFVAGFLVTLPAKGLDMLWKTHHSSQIMLGAAAWLVLLINAVHQDGRPDHAVSKFMRALSAFAMILISPLVLIAATAIVLRVQEYGWTANLVDITASLIVAACFGIGYFIAALPFGDPGKRLEKTNIATAFVTLAVLIALFSPIADPARISVADQIARLKNGVTPADKFDYIYLRDQGGKYGMDALVKMRAEAKTTEDKARIDTAMMKPKYSYVPPTPPKPEEMGANITVYPPGQHLPDSFLKQDWSKFVNGTYPACLYDNTQKCEAFLITDAVNSAPEIVITSQIGDVFGPMSVLKFDNNQWKLLGGLNGANCKSVADSMRAGNFAMVPATGEDLAVKGAKFQVIKQPECPK